MTESPRHDLDEAIDRVAAKLVEVPADDRLLARTIAQLPTRSATPWFLTLPAQATTAAALLLLAFLYASPSREPNPDESLPSNAPALPAEAQSVEAVSRPTATPVAAPQSLVPGPRLRQGDGGQARRSVAAVDRPDHERSLAPVDVIEALELGGITPSAIDRIAPALLEPLLLPALALDTKGDS